MCASWGTFNDTETAIVSYHFSLCSTFNEVDCAVSERNLANRTSICVEEPPFIEGKPYFVMIKATNEAGLSSTSKSFNFVVDTTEPDVGEVVVSNPLGEQYSFISSAVSARWNGFWDRESGIYEYLICIGKKAGFCDVAESISVNKTSHFTWHNLILNTSEEYFISVKGVNNARLFTSFIPSDLFKVDTTGMLSRVYPTK